MSSRSIAAWSSPAKRLVIPASATSRADQYGAGCRHRCRRVGAKRGDSTGRQLLDPLIDGKRGGDILMAEQQRDGVTIDLSREARMGHQRFQLRAKEECLAHPAVVERFLAEAITHEMQLPLLSVP